MLDDFATAQQRLERKQRIDRGKQILAAKAGKAVRPYRADGYVNMMNKYGTSRDSDEHYEFQPEPKEFDLQLTRLYEGHGLFSKIIDTPAEEAIKHGFDLGLKDDSVEKFTTDALDALDWEEKAATGIKWSRLYGGALGVMLIDDGGGLEDPLNWNRIRSIDEIRVYERSLVQPDYASMYSYDPKNPFHTRASQFGQPEFYSVFSMYGSFRVHESRCLIFRNGILPERTSNPLYRFWGMPEYVRIKRSLRQTVTSHEMAPKLLERSVQAIYKMNGLASLLQTEEGEDQVLKRLTVIDEARSILNSIAIDGEGEDYDFRTMQFSGVKDVIDSTCNMLSAVTNIPQTVLFGRSPAGENSTGENDMENYYNYIQRIQKLMLRRNLKTLLDIIYRAGVASKELQGEPEYTLTFNPLWSLSEKEQADVDKVKADTALVKAQAAQAYVDMQALDPSEVRAGLAKTEGFDVEDLIVEDDDDLGLGELQSDLEAQQKTQEELETSGGQQQPTATDQVEPFKRDSRTDGESPIVGAATIVIRDGKILIANRKKGGDGICGPGGHIEAGETPEQAAKREAKEEFNIDLGYLIPLGDLKDLPEEFGHPMIFVCTDFCGNISCDCDEMENPRFATLDEIGEIKSGLFKPFAESISMLLKAIKQGAE